MKAAELVKELNKRGKLPHKIFVRDVRNLWEAGWISGDKRGRECLGRTKFKLKDVKFNLEKTESEILFFLRKMDKIK